MLYNFIKKQSPNGTYHAFIDFNNEVFKREQWPNRDRFGKLYDYHVYLYIDTSKEGWVILKGLPPIKGQLIYIGRGVYDPNHPYKWRMLNHPGEELEKHITSSVCAFSVGFGMSYEESEALEAYYINTCGLELTERGKSWNGIGLINKKKELKNFEKSKKLIVWK